MKKIIAMLMALVMVVSLCAFNAPAASAETTVKAGFIFLHDENSTYDLNFINAAKEACEKLGVEYLLKTGIPEGQECYDAAAELVDEGCNGAAFAAPGSPIFLLIPCPRRGRIRASRRSWDT